MRQKNKVEININRWWGVLDDELTITDTLFVRKCLS